VGKFMRIAKQAKPLENIIQPPPAPPKEGSKKCGKIYENSKNKLNH